MAVSYVLNSVQSTNGITHNIGLTNTPDRFIVAFVVLRSTTAVLNFPNKWIELARIPGAGNETSYFLCYHVKPNETLTSFQFTTSTSVGAKTAIISVIGAAGVSSSLLAEGTISGSETIIPAITAADRNDLDSELLFLGASATWTDSDPESLVTAPTGMTVVGGIGGAGIVVAAYKATDAADTTYPSRKMVWSAGAGAGVMLTFRPKPTNFAPHIAGSARVEFNGTASFLDVMKPVEAGAGSVLIVDIYDETNSGTISAPAGWTLRGTFGNMPGKLRIYSKTLSVDDGVDSYQWGWNPNASKPRIGITCISDTKNISEANAKSVINGSTLSIDAPGVGVNNSLTFGIFYNDVDSAVTTAPASMNMVTQPHYPSAEAHTILTYEEVTDIRAATAKSITWTASGEELAGVLFTLDGTSPDTPSITAPVTSQRRDLTTAGIVVTGSAYSCSLAQQGWALRRRVSGGSYEWWNGATWQGTEIFNAGSANGHTFTSPVFDATATNGKTYLLSMAYTAVNGVASAYSSEITIIHNDTPTLVLNTPADLSTYTSSEIDSVATFTSGGTEAPDTIRYKLTLVGTGIVFDSGDIQFAGTTQGFNGYQVGATNDYIAEYSIPYTVEFGKDYSLEVTSKNIYGQASNSDTNAFEVNFVPPPTPTLIVSPVAVEGEIPYMVLKGSAIDEIEYVGVFDFIFERYDILTATWVSVSDPIAATPEGSNHVALVNVYAVPTNIAQTFRVKVRGDA